MNKTPQIALILGLSLFATTAVMAENAPEGAKTPFQDSKKAEEFFAAELDFKTNPYGVNKMIDEKAKDIIIVDVRSTEDYAKGHIPGAINIPYEKYNGFNGSETKFPGLTKDKVNIVYCYNHLCNLAQKAAKVFASNGYPVKEMVGGFEEWKNDKYSIEK